MRRFWVRDDSAHWGFAVVRRSIIFVVAPAAVGALVLIALLEIAVAYLRVEDGTLDSPVAVAASAPENRLALQGGPVDSLATASTSATELSTPASGGPAPVSLVLTGPFAILDGRTLATRDLTVVLADIAGPDARAVCIDAKRRRWACGLHARAALSRLVQQRSLSCRPAPGRNDSPILAACTVDEEDLARTLVRQGWARPIRDGASRFQQETEVARRGRAGLWNGGWTLVETARAEAAAAPTP
jgi:endonuclease YncB( thermonuclease family)